MLSSQNLKAEPGRRVRIFISHLWANALLYEDLVRVLDSLYSQAWVNTSLSKDAAVAVYADHEKSIRAAVTQEADRLKEVRSQRLSRLQQERAELQLELQPGNTLFRLKREQAAAIEKLRQERASERRIAFERAYYEERLEELRASPAVSRREAKLRRLEAVESEIAGIENDIACCEQAFQRVAHRKHGRFIEYSHRDRDIQRELYSRIRSADVVIVIGSSFAEHRKWLDFEIRTAQRLSTPIVLVIPPSRKRVPRGLRFEARHVIPWSALEIENALALAGRLPRVERDSQELRSGKRNLLVRQVDRLRDGGATLAVACEQVGVSPSSYRRWSRSE